MIGRGYKEHLKGTGNILFLVVMWVHVALNYRGIHFSVYTVTDRI